MKEFISEYRSMMQMEDDRKRLIAESAALTEKIDLARKLPGIVLESATIPIRDLTVKDGEPLIVHGLSSRSAAPKTRNNF